MAKNGGPETALTLPTSLHTSSHANLAPWDPSNVFPSGLDRAKI